LAGIFFDKLRDAAHLLPHKGVQTWIVRIVESDMWRFQTPFAILLLTQSLQVLADPPAGSSEGAVTDAIVMTTITPPVIVEGADPMYVAPTQRDRIGRIWAPVLINGKGPFRLVLDTGANSSALLPSVAQALGIPLHESKNVRLHGATGTAVVPIVVVDSLEVGDLFLGGERLPIVADVFGGAQGILGGKGLSDKRIFIDFGNDQIRISRSRSKAAPMGYTTVPIKVTSSQLLMMDILIGSVRTKAVLDTGAQQTIGNHALYEALIRRGRESSDQAIIGVTLDVAHGKSVPVPPIALGGIEVRNMRVTFGDMYIFEQWKMTHEPAMLLGMDVIGTLDTLIIDYKMRELQMRARR
jgi:predicted aspartyl protease